MKMEFLHALDDFMKVLADVADEKNLRVCFNECLKAGFLTGASTIVGGLLLGPVGLAVGGILGSSASAFAAKGKFKPLSVVIYNLSPKEKEDLFKAVLEALNNISPESVVKLILLIKTSGTVQELALRETAKYIERNYSCKIK